MTFYERLEQLRKERGISQSKLERELGFSNGSISKWKTSMPTLERCSALADYFGVSVEYLQTGEQPSGYYLNDETARIAQEIFDDPHKRALFDASRNATPEALDLVAKMLEQMQKEQNE